MRVYHGTILEIMHPEVGYTRSNLDFGPGFYVTTYKDQAEKWAIRKSLRKPKGTEKAIVNEYEVDDLGIYTVKKFADADSEWLHFVCDARNGIEVYKGFDVIIGNVADDEVMKCVRMYMRGIWDEKRTLDEMVYYKQNDQMAVPSQKVIDEAFHFVGSYEVK